MCVWQTIQKQNQINAIEMAIERELYNATAVSDLSDELRLADLTIKTFTFVVTCNCFSCTLHITSRQFSGTSMKTHDSYFQ